MKLRHLNIILIFVASFALMAAKALCSDTAETLEKQCSDKLAQARKAYSDSVRKILADQIKKYESLMKQETSAGRLDSALEIKKRIEKLKELEADPLSDAADPAEFLAGDDSSDNPLNTTSRPKMKVELEKRMQGFFVAVAQEKYDDAKEYLDPKSVALAPPEIINGYLKMFSGVMNAMGVKSESQIGLKDMELSSRKDCAKAFPRWRSTPKAEWNDGKDPQYWVLRHGKWYVGDEKALSKNFK